MSDRYRPFTRVVATAVTDLVICIDCSTRTHVVSIPKDETEQHDTWHLCDGDLECGGRVKHDAHAWWKGEDDTYTYYCEGV